MSGNSPSPTLRSTRRQPRQQRSKALVDRILDAAARLFEQDGRAETTTNHIAEAAGVSIGSLYQYFDNKEAILVALGHRHLDAVEPSLQALAERLQKSQPGPGELCDRYIEVVDQLNSSSRLHTILWHSTGTVEFNTRLDRLKSQVVEDLAWHLRRFGQEDALATASAKLLVVAVDAALHTLADGPDRVEIVTGLKRGCHAIASQTGAGPEA